MSDQDQKLIGEILAQTELFADFSTAQRNQIASISELLKPAAGEIVFAENSSGDELYIIGKGEIEIIVDPNLLSQESLLDPVTIAHLLPGDLLGEMALVDQGLRSATARVASEDTILVRLAREPLLALCQAQTALGFQLMYNLAADMAVKIRNTGLTLREYQLRLIYRSSQRS